MLFHLFAFSILVTFSSFIAGYACEKNAWSGLADGFFLVGTLFLSATYASIFLALLLYGLKVTFTGIRRYFSRTEAKRRKVLFRQGQVRNLQQRYRLEKQQILYHNARRRDSLCRDNNKKHIRSLSNSISANLATRQDRMSTRHYQSYKKALDKNCRSNNIEGLLKLHLEIMSFR